MAAARFTPIPGRRVSSSTDALFSTTLPSDVTPAEVDSDPFRPDGAAAGWFGTRGWVALPLGAAWGSANQADVRWAATTGGGERNGT